MKDYRLSEIKYICEKTESCKNCECSGLCFVLTDMRSLTEIEPRDMIDLPCKEHRINRNLHVIDVYYRNPKFGFIEHDVFPSETEADKFLQELKNGKV